MSVYLTRTLLLSLGISIFLTVCYHALREDLKLPPAFRLRDPKETFSATYLVRATGDTGEAGMPFKNAVQANVAATSERLEKAGFEGRVSPRNDSTYKVTVKNITDTNSVRELLSGNGNISFNEVYIVSEIASDVYNLDDEWRRFNGKKVDDTSFKFSMDVFHHAVTVTERNSDLSVRLPYLGLVDKTRAGLVLKMLADSSVLRKFPADILFRLGDLDHRDPQSSKYQLLYAIKKNFDPITNRNIADARPDIDENDHPFIALQFDAAGARRWEKITEKSIGKAIAICINDKVIIAPHVMEAITGGQSRISMSSMEQCHALSVLLTSSDLKLPARIIESEVKKEEKLSPRGLNRYANHILVFALSFAAGFCVIWLVFKPGKKLSGNA